MPARLKTPKPLASVQLMSEPSETVSYSYSLTIAVNLGSSDDVSRAHEDSQHNF